MCMLSCSTIHKTEEYYKNTTYNQTRNYSHYPTIIFEFNDSTYTNIEPTLYGHGKWRLSDDKKKLLLREFLKQEQKRL